jgi:biotin carboxyl carrier protein
VILWIEIGGRLRKVELPAALSAASTAPATAQPVPCRVDGRPFTVEARMLAPGVMSLLLLDEDEGGRQLRCVLDLSPEGDAVIVDGDRVPFTVADPRSLQSRRAAGAGGDGPRAVKAPMPGRVIRVLAAVGDEVAAQQGLVVIEAMKMQNELRSPKAGRVARLAVEAGAAVQSGDVLVVIE